MNRVLIGDIKINSVRNKLDLISSMVQDNIDTLLRDILRHLDMKESVMVVAFSFSQEKIFLQR